MGHSNRAAVSPSSSRGKSNRPVVGKGSVGKSNRPAVSPSRSLKLAASSSSRIPPSRETSNEDTRSNEGARAERGSPARRPYCVGCSGIEGMAPAAAEPLTPACILRDRLNCSRKVLSPPTQSRAASAFDS